MNAPAAAGLASISLKDPKLFREQCYIDGEWSGNGSTLPVINPATGAQLGTVPKLGAEETRRAIDAAERAWPAWRAKTGKERAAILRKWFELMMAHQEDLAQILTAEQQAAREATEGLSERYRRCLVQDDRAEYYERERGVIDEEARTVPRVESPQHFRPSRDLHDSNASDAEEPKQGDPAECRDARRQGVRSRSW
jgi:hypothetical protein